MYKGGDNMDNFLHIQETTIGTVESNLQKNQIKITNTSGHFINNLKLSIDKVNFPLVEQTIIRQRGTLSYDKDLCLLDLGNLAPDETALFEYKYQVENDKKALSLLNHIHISYTPESTTDELLESSLDE